MENNKNIESSFSAISKKTFWNYYPLLVLFLFFISPFLNKIIFSTPGEQSSDLGGAIGLVIVMPLLILKILGIIFCIIFLIFGLKSRSTKSLIYSNIALTVIITAIIIASSSLVDLL